MHELSLCQSAVEIVQQQAEQHGVKRVTGVWLEIGALSCVEESAVRFSFDIVCQGTLAQGFDRLNPNGYFKFQEADPTKGLGPAAHPAQPGGDGLPAGGVGLRLAMSLQGRGLLWCAASAR